MRTSNTTNTVRLHRTAVTVLKLVEQGRLRFEDRAFTMLDELRAPPGREPDPRIDR